MVTMAQAMNDIEEDMNKAFEQDALNLWEQFVDETERRALDTGALRSNWNAQYNEPDEDFTDRPQPPEPRSIDRPSKPQLDGKLSDGDTSIFVSNFTPYAKAAEEGAQGPNATPANFVKVGLQNWKSNR